MLLGMLLRILPAEKSVGQGFSVVRYVLGALTMSSGLGIMSGMKTVLGKIYTIILAEKPVGKGFQVAWHVLWVFCTIAFYTWLYEYMSYPILAEVILCAGLAGLGFAIWFPGLLFSTELVDDYRSFLPHWAEHCYRDLTQFITLLRAHISSLVCLLVSLPGNPPRPCVSCEEATHDSVRLQHLILATTHILRAPPSFA